MKFKIRYMLLAAFAAFCAYVYWQYDWRWNPWAPPRLVWEEPDPALVGQTFSIIVPAAYRCTGDLPIPVKQMGVECDIDFDPKPIPIPSAEDIAKANRETHFDSVTQKGYAPAVSSTSGQYVQPAYISKDEVFVIKRTYFITLNFWEQAFRSEYRHAIASSAQGKYIVSNIFLYSNKTNRNDFDFYRFLNSSKSIDVRNNGIKAYEGR